MDELERRLTAVLTRASELADPAVARLRNPAEHRPPAPARWRPARLAVVAAASLAVAGVAAGVVLTAPKAIRLTPPVAPTVPVLGTSDGTHPLWALRVREGYEQTWDGLPVGGNVSLPLPHTSGQSLVTAAGTVRLPSHVLFYFAQRGQNSFVALGGPGEGDGMHDVSIEIIGPDNARRVLHHVAELGSVAVSPDGTLLALTRGGAQPAVELVNVPSGRVVQRQSGPSTGVVWASDRTLLLQRDSGKLNQPDLFAWRAPWTGALERVPVRGFPRPAVAGGSVALDEIAGCLQRLDANATVTEVNCNGWRSDGGASPDGRYVPLAWGSESAPHHGVLDLTRNEVRAWPVPGVPQWLGPDDVLLAQADVDDLRATARCDLRTHSCAEVVLPADWVDATWIGS